MFGHRGGYHPGGGGRGGGGGASIQSLLSSLQSLGAKDGASFDPFMETAHVQLDYLSQICERLAMVQQEGELSGLRVQDLCRTLTQLLPDHADTPDIMGQHTTRTRNSAPRQRSHRSLHSLIPPLSSLVCCLPPVLSARAMCNLMEALPGSASILVDTENCVPQLLEKLMNISSLDAAEQTVLTLQKMSRERAPSLLKAGGLAALLTFLDFFPTSMQRTCLQTAANLVVRVPPDCMDLMLQSIPLVLAKLASKQGLDESIHSVIILFLQRVTNIVTATDAAHLQYGGYSGSSSSAHAKNTLTQAQIMSRIESSGLVRAVVDLLRHALKEPSLFASTAITSLLTILVSLTRKSAKIAEELLSTICIVPLLVDVHSHITGTTSSDSSAKSANAAGSAMQMPSSSPKLSASPSVRTSQAPSASSGTAQQLNPLLSLAMELLPDLRASRTSTYPTQANASGEAAASARNLFQQAALSGSKAAASSAAAAASGSAATSPSPSAVSAPMPIPSRSRGASGASSSADARLTFLSPPDGGGRSASPSANLLDDAALEQMDAEDEAEQVRRDMGEGGEEEDSSDFSASPAPAPLASPPLAAAASSPAPAAAASATLPPGSKFKSTIHEQKAAFLLKNPELLQTYIRGLLPLFTQAALSSTDNHLRYKCVSGMLRILCVVESKWLLDASLFPPAAVCGFVHNLLSTSDANIGVAALQLVELLMTKAPDTFGPQLFREGCVDTIQEVAEQGLAAAQINSAAAPAPTNGPSSLTLQQRAKLLLTTHFEQDVNDDASAADADVDDDAAEPSSMGDDSALGPSTPSGRRSPSMTFSPSMGTPSSSVNTPSKRKRRFSSCATPIFKRAQTLALDAHRLLKLHAQLCKQMHETAAAGSPDLVSLSSTLEQTENSLLLCLSSICTCLLGNPGAAPLPAASAALPSPTSPNSPMAAANAPTLQSSDILTVHEFLHSGLLDALLALLFNPASAAKFAEATATASESDVWKVTWSELQVAEELALQRRQRLFGHVFFGLPKRAVPAEEKKSDDAEPLASAPTPEAAPPTGDSLGDQLLFKLIECLESLDPFTQRSCGVQPAHALRLFSMPFRVKLTFKPERNVAYCPGQLEPVPIAEIAEGTTAGKAAEPATSSADAKQMDVSEDEQGSRPSSAKKKGGRSSGGKQADTSPDSSPAPRRMTRGLLARSQSAPEEEEAEAEEAAPAKRGSKAAAAKSTPPKKGIAASIVSAVSAIKSKVGGRGAKTPEQVAAAAEAAAAAAEAAVAAERAAHIAANLPQLYPARTVMIDTLATFQSIESFLHDSLSLWDLFDRTERVYKGLSPHRTAADVAAEDQLLAMPGYTDKQAAAAAASSSGSSSRSGSRKKKGGASSASNSRPSSPHDEAKERELEHQRMIDGVRRARVDAEPVRVSFRFARKQPGVSQPQSYPGYSVKPAPAVVAVPDADDEWHEIALSKSTSIFEAIQMHHPAGWHGRQKLIAEQKKKEAAAAATALTTPQKADARSSASSSSSAAASSAAASASSVPAAAAAAPAPWSAYEMFNQVFEIEFRLIRGHAEAPVDTNSCTPSTANSRAASPALLTNETKSVSSLAAAKSDVAPARAASAALAARLQSALSGSSSHSKSAPTLASLLLLLDSLHDLSHHWASLYSSWPAMVDFFSAHDSAGNGTTGRNLALPLSVQSASGSFRSQLPYSHAFVSTKLSRKLQLQCEDPVVVLGDMLPAWVHMLSRDFPFLFHFSARELLFRVSAFENPARHLLNLHNHLKQTQPQAMTQASGRSMSSVQMGASGQARIGMLDGEALSSDDEDGMGRARPLAAGSLEMAQRYRMQAQQDGGQESEPLQAPDRVQAVKVQVNRSNILSAAKRIFRDHSREVKAGGIRAEFHGEAGVGVGPTLEFFTLVSQQMQLKKLFIWNKPDVKPTLNAASKPTEMKQPDSATALAAVTETPGGDMDMEEPTPSPAGFEAPSSAATAAAAAAPAAMDLDDAAGDHLPAPKVTAPLSRAASAGANESEGESGRHTKRKRQPSLPLSSAAQSAAAAAAAAVKVAETDSKRAKKRASPIGAAAVTVGSHSTPAAAAAAAAAASSSSSPPFVPLRGSPALPPLSHGTVARMGEFFEFGLIQCPSCNVVEVPYCPTHKQFLTVREQGGQWKCAGPLPPPPPPEPKPKAKRKASKTRRGSKGKKAESEEEEEDATATTAAAAAPAPVGAPVREPCSYSTRTISAHCTFCAELNPSSAVGAVASSFTPSPPRRRLLQWRVHSDELDYVRTAFPKGALLHSHISLLCPTCHCVNFPGYHSSHYALSNQSSAVSMLVGNKGGQMVNVAHNILQEKSYRAVTRHVTYACDMAPLSLQPVVLVRKTLIDVIDACKENSPRLAKPADMKAEAATAGAPSSSVSASTALPVPPSSFDRSSSQQSMEETEEKQSGAEVSKHAAVAPSDSLPDGSSSAAPIAPTIPANSTFDAPQSAFVTSSALYPPPTTQRLSSNPTLQSGVHPTSLEWLWILGRFLGQALADQKLLDLPFSQTLLKQLSATWYSERGYTMETLFKSGGTSLLIPRITQQSAPASVIERAAEISPPPPSLVMPLMLSLLELSPHIAKPLLKLLALCYHRFSPALYPLPPALRSIDGATIEELDFDFTLPGHPEIDLVPNGASVTVTSGNAHVWLWLVARQLVCEGVVMQLSAIQQGLRVCVNTERLKQFYPHGQTTAHVTSLWHVVSCFLSR